MSRVHTRDRPLIVTVCTPYTAARKRGLQPAKIRTSTEAVLVALVIAPAQTAQVRARASGLSGVVGAAEICKEKETGDTQRECGYCETGSKLHSRCRLPGMMPRSPLSRAPCSLAAFWLTYRGNQSWVVCLRFWKGGDHVPGLLPLDGDMFCPLGLRFDGMEGSC